MDDKELMKRLHDAAEDYVLHGYLSDAIRAAAARITALAEEVKTLTDERTALRVSLEQEIRGTLKARGFWSGNAESSTVINAVGAALDKLAEENERLKKRLGMVKSESDRDARDAAIEARWQARNEANGEPYGTY